ncbi:hypothetical protein M409DRAFT_71550 [Zasmidium cellare ATCC 36951]|uniref:Mediator of RNA polymerase II transcription subunit 5 n=1 Tax=Zasmidium cellare ATCC 36951 TaxID=1080233 RepID=A0A6A6BX43_ZASCE|nr:uncharacterized protein M409DRAFT_71550 [Zasmidium cellare ATCC 36951]KAF2158608.1 hypothetical protein M409DRAFT_71550 [Zasmidium cellare ATCC 36951]
MPNQFLAACKASESSQTRQTKAKAGEIATALLAFRSSKVGADDPFLFPYARGLINEKYIGSGDLLFALLRSSLYGRDDPEAPVATGYTGMPSCEERIFTILMQMYSTTHIPTAPLEIWSLVQTIYRWLKAVNDYEVVKQLEGGGLHTVDAITFGSYEALGKLAIAVFDNASMREVMKQQWWKEHRAAVTTELVNFDTHILQWMNSQFAGRLRMVTGSVPFIPLDKNGEPQWTDQQILDSIPEIPVIPSRAAAFVWLNAALVARPLTDDMTVYSYLHGRSPNDVQMQVSDLLVASFDCLTNAMLRKESRQDVRIIQSFLCNKVPHIISMLSRSIAPPMTAESCIQMTLIPGGHISMDPLAPITPGANQIRDSLKGARLEFLQACALHGLVSEGTISSILQESIALPRVTRHNKDALVAQCANNISRLENHIEDLDAFQGNAGAIANCIVETVTNLCMSKDTMSLKSVCNWLMKKVSRIDIVMIFAQPGMLLLPICTLLNDWIHDQEQTEFTPSYEEFASILLFALTVIHRYDLKGADIGILPDSFVARLLDDMSISNPLNELSPEQASQLGKWIEGLYAVDEHGETSGIGDDVMRQCSPQAFYQLVPTLFEQSILACRTNALSIKTFKGGLELLLEPFLLPSLVMGLRWLAEHSWEDHNDTEVLLHILDKLLNLPKSSPPETKAMHVAILTMVATPLYESLQELLRRQPEKKKAADLSQVLKQYLYQQRTLSRQKHELDEIYQKDGSVQNRIRRSIRELVEWSSTPSNPPNPPPRYTYKEFALACQLLDGVALRDVMVQELSQSPNAPTALDVCTSLVCVPVPVPMAAQQQSHPNCVTTRLRNSIALVAADIQSVKQKEVAEAEALVRLCRRVEAQLAVVQIPPMAIPMQQIQDQTAADQMMQELGLDLPGNGDGTSVDAAINQNDLTGLEQQLDLSNPTNEDLANMAVNTGAMDIDQSQLLSDMDFTLSSTQNNGQQVGQQNQEEDIFAGLDMGGMSGMDDLGDLGEDFNFG